MAKPEKTETPTQIQAGSQPATAKETATAPTSALPEASAGPKDDPNGKEPEPVSEEAHTDSRSNAEMARRVGCALAHLERLQGGAVMALVVDSLAGDLLRHGESGDEEFDVLEAMLQELGQHDNLAHLAAARKAMA